VRVIKTEPVFARRVDSGFCALRKRRSKQEQGQPQTAVADS
jgi:hypothetical protein